MSVLKCYVLAGEIKLKPHPGWSPLGVLFKFSDDHPWLFHIGVLTGAVSCAGNSKPNQSETLQEPVKRNVIRIEFPFLDS